MSFSIFKFDERINKAIDELGFKEPTPIQALAIPKIFEASDVIASAQTGTGKTAAFMLPILDLLVNDEMRAKPSVLILVPTRELAMQVAEQAKKLGKYLPSVKTVCIYGGVPYPVQKKMLSSKYDILVATPGRLLDHMEQGRINLSGLKILVLDEADRMLDMGFIDDIEEIVKASPAERQTLMFSATIDRKILPISKKLQRDPVEIKTDAANTENTNIEQKLFYVDNIHHKMNLLNHFLENEGVDQAIVFTSTKRHAEELSDQLRDKGHLSSPLHGDMNQKRRTQTVSKMHRGNINILVATDVAARGIDIPALSYVINFDLPFNSEDFIHRIGRTGRAGSKGIAITFATYKEEGRISQINRLMKNPLEIHTITGLEPKPKTESSGKKPFRRKRGPNSSFFGKKRPGSFAKRSPNHSPAHSKG